jgi:hypothetical protein
MQAGGGHEHRKAEGDRAQGRRQPRGDEHGRDQQERLHQGDREDEPLAPPHAIGQRHAQQLHDAGAADDRDEVAHRVRRHTDHQGEGHEHHRRAAANRLERAAQADVPVEPGQRLAGLALGQAGRVRHGRPPRSDETPTSAAPHTSG